MIVRPARPIPAGQSVVLRYSYAGGEKLPISLYRSEVSFALHMHGLVSVDCRGK